MRFIKHILGFNSPYSWTKWIRIPFAAVALYITFVFWSEFGFVVMGGGIIGLIAALIIFVLIFGPTVAALLGIAVAVGAVIGAAQSGKKQVRSLRESAESEDAALLSLDRLRLKVQVVNALFVVFIIAEIVGSVIFFFNADDLGLEIGEHTVYIVEAIMLVLVAAFWVAKSPMNKRYKDAFKELVVIKGLESVLVNMDFRPTEKLDEPIVKASQMFEFNEYSGNDYLSAEYHGIRFTQSDIHLQESREETYRDSDGDTHTRKKYTTIFHGTFMVFDHDAISNEPVAVYPKSKKVKYDENSILTELDAFNSKFTISANDAVTAFRILTPPVLEGIVLAADKLGCPVSLSFRDDKLYVAIANGDSFEATAVGDATLSEQRNRITQEIRTVLDMVETLYLKN
ncbi:MAG: DUF3137 domain-containing protein [Oscillospiraceae bacterium]|jgi:hypothetical protein|nr:DUF3137 domain-containing protein [Oscillospiraceae bacterium]